MFFKTKLDELSYWYKELPAFVQSKYLLDNLPHLDRFQIITHQSNVCVSYLVFFRLIKMMGIKFKKYFLEKMNTRVGDYYFNEPDLKSIGARVKHMSVVHHSQGYVYR